MDNQTPIYRLAIIPLLITLGGLAFYLSTRSSAPEQTQQPIIVPTAKVTSDQSPPPVTFTDITETAGITFVHSNGAVGDKLLPETMGGGVAFLDYDNDGDPDLLLVNGNHWGDANNIASTAPVMALYRNDGLGTFTDVTEEAGLNQSFYGMGVACGDIDGDAWIDLFFTAVGSNRLFKNAGGRFHEITDSANVAGSEDAWSSGAVFFDYDNDSDLDLFVANYIDWSREIDFEVDFRLTGIGRAYGPPSAFASTQPYLYRNDGSGRFSDVSIEAGIQVFHPATGNSIAKGLGVMALDLDQDGDMDLLMGNDTVRNFFYRNLGDGKFEESGEFLGIAFDRDGSATGAMGIDAAFYRGDNEMGIAIGNFANEMTSLYVSQQTTDQFADESIIEGIGAPSRRALTFGLFFFDYDLDGRLDLLQANGHLEDQINRVQSSQHYAQPAQLFWNCGEQCSGTFVEVAADNAGDLYTPLVGRGAAYADIDGDGDPDIIITQVGRRPMLLRNDQQSGHHWISIRLFGPPGNPAAIGARIELTVAGHTQRRTITRTRSYLSQVEPVATFGLGLADKIDKLVLIWPDGTRQDIDPSSIAVDQAHSFQISSSQAG